jgi:hypothetical protein
VELSDDCEPFFKELLFGAAAVKNRGLDLKQVRFVLRSKATLELKYMCSTSAEIIIISQEYVSFPPQLPSRRARKANLIGMV